MNETETVPAEETNPGHQLGWNHQDVPNNSVHIGPQRATLQYKSATWKRSSAAQQPPINQTDRVSRPRYLLVLRPLSKFKINNIPKQALAHLIGNTAPQPYLAELASHRYDTLGNCLHITTYDETHKERLLAVTQLQFPQSGTAFTLPVEIKPSLYRPNSSRGVIEIEPDDTNDQIKQWLRSEQAKILDCHRLGRTNKAVITFDSPVPPKVVKYYMAIVKVSPYQPRRMVCYNCHNIGHMSKYCPSQTVCQSCGKMHPESDDCGPTIYCVVCDEFGHISLNPTCPGRVPQTTQSSPAKDKAQGISWVDRIKNSPKEVEFPSLTPTLKETRNEPKTPDQNPQLTAILAQLNVLRIENQQLKAEIAELKRTHVPKRNTPNNPPSKQSMAPLTGRGRSPSSKRTPTSQAKNDPQLTQTLQTIRTEIHQERLARLEDGRRMQEYFEGQLKHIRDLIDQVLKSMHPPEPIPEPPRKVPPRSQP